MNFSDTIIMIPSRLGSTRLNQKPLLKINGIPLIIHVLNCAKSANLNIPIIVATDDQIIANEVKKYGGLAIMTSKNHISGSDRIHEALEKFDPNKKYKKIIHLQGDLPNISGKLIKKLAKEIQDISKEIITVVVKAKPEEFEDSSVVKVAIAFSNVEDNQTDVGNALYFSRACIPTGNATVWHHIGIYSWRRDTLERFVKLKPSPLEKSEKLEQLRALEAGINIHSIVTDEHPIGVDTQKDLEKAENYFRDLT